MDQVMNKLSYRKSKIARPDVYFIYLAIKIINQNVETQISITIEPNENFSLQRIMIFNLLDAFLRSYMLRWRIVIILPKYIEALAICSRNESQLAWEGDFEERIEDYEDTQELNCFDNGCVRKMMTRMGYKQGLGLGHCNQGPPTFFLEIQKRKSTFGLGYRPTHLDDIRHTRMVHERARARANDIPFEVPMRPYPSSLNGQFVRAGEIELFWGFKKPVIVASGWGNDSGWGNEDNEN